MAFNGRGNVGNIGVDAMILLTFGGEAAWKAKMRALVLEKAKTIVEYFLFVKTVVARYAGVLLRVRRCSPYILLFVVNVGNSVVNFRFQKANKGEADV